MFIANLIEKHWLYRTFNVITPEDYLKLFITDTAWVLKK